MRNGIWSVTDEDWYVGLVEIAFNPFTPGGSERIIQKDYNDNAHEYISSTSSEEESRASDVEEYEYGQNSNKRKHSFSPIDIDVDKTLYTHADLQSEKQTIVPIDETYSLQITSSFLNKIAYNTKKRDINGAKFFEHLAECITPKTDDDAVKKSVMDRILMYIDSKNWPSIETKSSYRRNDAHMLHLYFGSPVSSNCILQYKTFSSVEEFIQEIVMQIPPKRRNNKSLKTLFKIFSPYYNKKSQVDAPKTPTLDTQILA